MFSKTVLNGRLVKEPVLRNKTKNGRVVKWTYYRLAVNRNGGDGADFINCVAFGWQAEFAKQYMKQGTGILVAGRLRNYSYRDKNGICIPTVQLLVEIQGLCGNWCMNQDNAPERIFDHSQDFPAITEQDLEVMEEYEYRHCLP